MKKIYILALAALALAFSCQKNENTPEPASEQKMITITGTIAQPDSKVAISSTDGKTSWEENDEILFHGKGAGGKYSATVKLTAENISADGKTFTVTIPDFSNEPDASKWARSGNGYSVSNIIAAYPASAVAVDGGATNWYTLNRFNETNLPLMSGFNDGFDSKSIIFYNLCGILSFVVTEDFDSYTLAGNNGETVAYDNYASRLCKKTDDSIHTEWVAEGSALTSISGPITAGEETRIFLPNGANFTGGFTINFKKDGDFVKTLSTTKSVEIARNSYRPMGDVTSYLKTYVPPATHTPSDIPMTDVTPLDDSGNANCYIVNYSVDAGKVFTFKAYKGNSSSSVGTVASAEILWETWNNDQTVTKNSVIKAVDFEKKAENDYYTMVIQMPATLHKGNALIAAKDAEGKILWSWHIWVPESYPSSNTYGIHDTRQMMDRNLGAINAPNKDVADPQNAGFFYQWGRKDPLRTISAFDTGALATTNPASVWTTSSTQLTTDNMEASPCVFIKNNTDWLSTRENTLWANDKQIHDPCPVGYKVPKQGYTDFFEYFTIANYAGWSFNEANYNFTIGKTADPVAVFPFGHITRYGGYDLSDSKAWVWTATYKTDNAENARAVTVASESSSSCTGQRKANGVYVRCVAE